MIITKVERGIQGLKFLSKIKNEFVSVNKTSENIEDNLLSRRNSR